MALKRHVTVVHVLEGGDVAFRGRRRGCLPFLKQTNYIVKIMKFHKFVFDFITLFYFYAPGHPPAAPTRPLLPADCCVSPFLMFFGPRGGVSAV